MNQSANLTELVVLDQTHAKPKSKKHFKDDHKLERAWTEVMTVTCYNLENVDAKWGKAQPDMVWADGRCPELSLILYGLMAREAALGSKGWWFESLD